MSSDSYDMHRIDVLAVFSVIYQGSALGYSALHPQRDQPLGPTLIIRFSESYLGRCFLNLPIFAT